MRVAGKDRRDGCENAYIPGKSRDILLGEGEKFNDATPLRGGNQEAPSFAMSARAPVSASSGPSTADTPATMSPEAKTAS